MMAASRFFLFIFPCVFLSHKLPFSCNIYSYLSKVLFWIMSRFHFIFLLPNLYEIAFGKCVNNIKSNLVCCEIIFWFFFLMTHENYYYSQMQVLTHLLKNLETTVRSSSSQFLPIYVTYNQEVGLIIQAVTDQITSVNIRAPLQTLNSSITLGKMSAPYKYQLPAGSLQASTHLARRIQLLK